MENESLISIILPNHNNANYLWRTIESVIAQTYKNWELIAVDDGSSDDSVEVIKKYAAKDRRIKPTFLEQNVGMCTVFNIALEQAKGKYIARIDSDDFWEPGKLARQYEYMESNPNCGATFTWVRVIDENEQEVPTTKCEGRDKNFNTENRTRAQWLRTFFFEGCRVCHPSAMIRREALEKVGGKYNYIYRQIQDLDLWIRIAKHYDIYVIPEKLTNYRWFQTDKTNASASNPGTLTRGLFEMYRIMSHFNDNIPDELFLEAFHDDMFDKGAKSHGEIACERAFIMYHNPYLGNIGRVIGLSMLDKLYNDSETREILIKKYGFTAMKYSEWTSYPVFYDSVYVCPPQEFKKANTKVKDIIKKWLSKWPFMFKFAQRCYCIFRKK